MPVKCSKRGNKWRIVGPDGTIEKSSKGSAVDGGGHNSQSECQRQARAINASISNQLSTNGLSLFNPLRVDPTLTKTLRRKLFAELKRLVRELGNSLADRVEATPLSWLLEDVFLFELPERLGKKAHSSIRFSIGQAFTVGVRNAFYSTNPGPAGSAFQQGALFSFLRSAVSLNTELINTISISTQGTFQTQLNRASASAYTFSSSEWMKGSKPSVVKSVIKRSVLKGTDKKLQSLVSFEIPKAFTEGQLAGFRMRGVRKVRTRAAGSKQFSSCSDCVKLASRQVDVSKASGVLPLHPSCFCIWTVDD